MCLKYPRRDKRKARRGVAPAHWTLQSPSPRDCARFESPGKYSRTIRPHNYPGFLFFLWHSLSPVLLLVAVSPAVTPFCESLVPGVLIPQLQPTHLRTLSSGPSSRDCVIAGHRKNIVHASRRCCSRRVTGMYPARVRRAGTADASGLSFNCGVPSHRQKWFLSWVVESSLVTSRLVQKTILRSPSI